MKLQILITQYKETDKVIKPLLDSIAIQQNVDFNEIGVIIVNDGSDIHLSKALMDNYEFHIEYWQVEHKGVSAARNAAMDLATADYIMFCDADDMFVNNCGLYQIFLDIEGGFDTLNPVFIEEARRNGKPVYVTHENDCTFIHGKVHRRQYLIDNNIRWDENLTIHEDSYFHILAQSLTDRMKICNTPYYLWRWREDSVCRSDELYLLKTFDKFLDSNDALVDELIRRGDLYKAMYYCTHMVFETYYTMNKPDTLSDENKEYREKIEKRFSAYFKKHKSLWDKVPTADKVNISAQARDKVIKRGMLVEAITVFDWLEKIGGEQCPQEK